ANARRSRNGRDLGPVSLCERSLTVARPTPWIGNQEYDRLASLPTVGPSEGGGRCSPSRMPRTFRLGVLDAAARGIVALIVTGGYAIGLGLSVQAPVASRARCGSLWPCSGCASGLPGLLPK